MKSKDYISSVKPSLELKHALLTPQLTLVFTLRDEATFQSFCVGENQEIVSVLREAAISQGECLVYLHGHRGEGLSHLLQATCHHAYQHQVSSIYLPLRDLLVVENGKEAFTPEIFLGLESLSVICIDDLQLIAGLAPWEEAFFHLFNRIQAAGRTLIIAASDGPKALGIHLPDLVSRLSGCMVYAIEPLKDEDKKRVLMSRAESRGIPLSEEVSNYILTHCDRHISVLMQALDALDKASLATKRRLTIPFVKEVLRF